MYIYPRLFITVNDSLFYAAFYLVYIINDLAFCGESYLVVLPEELCIISLHYSE